MPPRSVAVVGGGLAGLTAAYRLASRGARVTLLEPSRIGGWAQTQTYPVSFDRDGRHYKGEVTLEAGPRSIRPRGGPGAPAMLQLIHDLGLDDRIVPIPNDHPAAKNRYLYDPDRGTLSAVHASPLALFNPRTAPAVRQLMLAFAMEPFRRSRPPKGDESVASFFTRRFGADVARTASAFVHGIYAADPAHLSLRSAFGILHAAEKKAGSVVLGMLRGPRPKAEVDAETAAWAAIGPLGKAREGWSMYALRGGMGQLISGLEARARDAGVEFRKARVLRLSPDSRVNVETSYGPLRVDHVVAALPPPRLQRVLSAPLPHLSANPSTTVGVVNVVLPLPPKDVHPNGFGYLIPRGGHNPEGALGVIFDSTALPGTDEGGLEGAVTKLTVMLGGPHWSSYGGVRVPAHDDELVPLALAHLQRAFPHLDGVHPLLTVANLNHACIPTYAPGHGARLRELHEAIGTGPWAGRLSVVGAGYGGVSVNDCVLGADLVAKSLDEGTVTGLERWAEWE
ncbi:Protoporphyrinogen oxidase [Cutaneotrichosporon oleaginosum]|uniref:Protoporphyrinogen oxidase n=1 Tax=Cutaneotrichosporon oleaginosum TaxID=879819 RepID=A0A0J0XW37_9TREE|nr:Protoporphyrinogen oxidase [Cutaneotrichosporon oleaginosum]KLT45286.1 Protoporphyrinogen oxidase [Cutaneotrichosporon oleaginosum]TXT14885.1 hypothetical protein COLE_01078 [Cutaneotrichosporon oleaginosum]